MVHKFWWNQLRSKKIVKELADEGFEEIKKSLEGTGQNLEEFKENLRKMDHPLQNLRDTNKTGFDTDKIGSN